MNTDRLEARVEATRSQLGSTLDAIEDRLDLGKQARYYGQRVHDSYRRNPVPWIIGATAASIVAVGLVVWAFVGDD